MRAEQQGIDRATGDYMGMMATVMNCLCAAGQSRTPRAAHTGAESRWRAAAVAEPYVRRKAISHMEKGRIVIFAGGSRGNPFFTTDTAAALRAAEIGADVIFKATRVKGVYDKDPELHGDAVFFPEISYMEVLSRNLKVMDATAISLCMENRLPIVVFNLREKGSMRESCSW